MAAESCGGGPRVDAICRRVDVTLVRALYAAALFVSIVAGVCLLVYFDRSPAACVLLALPILGLAVTLAFTNEDNVDMRAFVERNNFLYFASILVLLVLLPHVPRRVAGLFFVAVALISFALLDLWAPAERQCVLAHVRVLLTNAGVFLMLFALLQLYHEWPERGVGRPTSGFQVSENSRAPAA